jgi:hypothetical protein
MLGSVNSIEGDPSAGVIFFHGKSKATGEPTVFRQILSYQEGKPPLPNGIDFLLTHGSTLSNIEGVPPDQLPLLVSTIGTGSGNASGNYATTIAAEDTGENSADGSMSLKICRASTYTPFRPSPGGRSYASGMIHPMAANTAASSAMSC